MVGADRCDWTVTSLVLEAGLAAVLRCPLLTSFFFPVSFSSFQASSRNRHAPGHRIGGSLFYLCGY